MTDTLFALGGILTIASIAVGAGCVVFARDSEIDWRMRLFAVVLGAEFTYVSCIFWFGATKFEDAFLFACGLGTVSLFGFGTLMGFTESRGWKQRLGALGLGLLVMFTSFMFWFGGIDIVRAMLFYMPEPLRSFYIWIARL
jgi:hypothetical protein